MTTPKHYPQQFAYQHAHACGRILNVGADADTSDFRGRGAVNVDIWRRNPWTGMTVAADLLVDARNLGRDLDGKPTLFYGSFHCVILGDILEHFVERADVIQALTEAKKCLLLGGRVIVTCPEDYRHVANPPPVEQDARYPLGARAWHAYAVTKAIMEGWFADAGLCVLDYGVIDYDREYKGHGFVVGPSGRTGP